jgi:hypothetical protein
MILVIFSPEGIETHKRGYGSEITPPSSGGNLGKRSQRPQVKLLPYGLVRVAQSGGYQRGEIFDLRDGVFPQ